MCLPKMTYTQTAVHAVGQWQTTEDANTLTQLNTVLLFNTSFEYLIYKCDVPYYI